MPSVRFATNQLRHIRSAVVLAAGYGTRLRPLTAHHAKPSLPLFHLPVIGHILRQLENTGISRVFINLHSHAWSVRRALRPVRFRGMEIQYSYEPIILGTAGALYPLRHVLRSEPFLLINGDIVTDLDFLRVIDTHVSHPDTLATLVLHPPSLTIGFPAVGSSHDGVLTRFPYGNLNRKTPEWTGTFTGIHVINPRIFDFMPSGGFQCINSSVYARAIRAGHTFGTYRHDGYWNDIGTPDRYFDAHCDIISGTVAIPGIPQSLHPPIWIAPDTVIHPSARLEKMVVIGARTRIQPDTHLTQVIVLPGCSVPAGSHFQNGILMPPARFIPITINEGL
ncbi:NDP-sugar synthase [bacterium]|nr:NDP-sugar synthase [candidate division CSSED10-310 bacterium]